MANLTWTTPWWGVSNSTHKMNTVGATRMWHRVKITYTRNESARSVYIKKIELEVTGDIKSGSKWPSSPPKDNTKPLYHMAFSIPKGGAYVKFNGSKVINQALSYNWADKKYNAPHTMASCEPKKTYYYNDDGKLSIKVELFLYKDGLSGKTTPTTGHFLKIGDNNSTAHKKPSNPMSITFNGGKNISPVVKWEAPSTSGFRVQVENYSTKPDGTFKVKCSGLSGGTGNGTTKNYQVYFTVYRDGSKIFTSGRYSVGANTYKEFRPSDFYKSRPGDNIYGHGVGLTKGADNADKQLIDVVAPHPGDDVPIKVYKDGIVYCKDYNGNLHEVTMAYCKDTGGTERKLRYIPVRDSNGVEHIIDMYTTSYE